MKVRNYYSPHNTGQSAYSKLKPYRCHICAENGKRVAFGELEELREHKIKEHS